MSHQNHAGNRTGGGPIGASNRIFKAPHEFFPNRQLEASRRAFLQGISAPHKYFPKKVETCVICLDDILDNQKVGELVNCIHRYHADCVQKWLCIKNFCPLCKTTAYPHHVLLKDS
ncbi:PREDICTED: RING finger protein 215-like [Erythranthe guttata]|uniref:RING finger protein 215-like n=1 Tax=Erythranthe guttata TaxID=4155 RepID=UPI00064E1540|nr:PREDICTED: RING finger protein 215-like [Erythranthe guttata]|eukprot:XP_012839312.1 PREDICTED: RING finger protein 215-like [Erythranthe guttata]